jgi:hypothetical protein
MLIDKKHTYTYKSGVRSRCATKNRKHCDCKQPIIKCENVHALEIHTQKLNNLLITFIVFIHQIRGFMTCLDKKKLIILERVFQIQCKNSTINKWL